jgi:hypothetical protein
MVSFPPRPSIESAPLPPQVMSLLAVPFSVSDLFVS